MTETKKSNGGNGNEFRERWTFYDLPDAADLLGIRYSTLFGYMLSGRIKFDQFEGRFCIEQGEIDKYLKTKHENWGRCGKPKKIKLRRRIIN